MAQNHPGVKVAAAKFVYQLAFVSGNRNGSLNSSKSSKKKGLCSRACWASLFSFSQRSILSVN